MNVTAEDTKAINATRRIVTFGILSGLAFAIYCLFLSREHITFVGYFIRLKPIEAETLFLFIDFTAMFGKMLTSKRLSAKTNRIGYKWMIGGGSLSLVCNVAAGIIQGNLGEAGYGAALVGLIVCLEYTIANTKAKASRKGRKAQAAPAVAVAAIPKPATKKCPAGCTCGKHNRTRTPKIPAAAPVSPGPMGPGPAGLSAAELHELVPGTPAYI